MRRRKRPIPAVMELVRLGLLCPYDAEWIGRLKPESQLASAKKCQKPNPVFIIHQQERSTITHARRSA